MKGIASSRSRRRCSAPLVDGLDAADDVFSLGVVERLGGRVLLISFPFAVFSFVIGSSFDQSVFDKHL